MPIAAMATSILAARDPRMRSAIVTRVAQTHGKSDLPEPKDERSWRSPCRPFASNRLYRAVRDNFLIAGVELLAGRFSPGVLLAEADIAFLDAPAERVNDVRSDPGLERLLHQRHKIIGHDN